MNINESKEMRIITLKKRKEDCVQDDQELWNRIEENAKKGEFELYFIHNKKDEYPTLSEEMIKNLKEHGFKVDPWEKKGWDNLHRYYKGPISVTWYK